MQHATRLVFVLVAAADAADLAAGRGVVRPRRQPVPGAAGPGRSTPTQAGGQACEQRELGACETPLEGRLLALRGGETVTGFLPPWLRVVMRLLFPGNPLRERAEYVPPPKAPPAESGAPAAKSKGKGAVISIHSKAEFDQQLKSARTKQLVVVDFFATWCGPCKQIAPRYEAMAAEIGHAKFLKVDVDQCKDISQAYGVKSMPTFKFIRNGAVLDTMAGADDGALREKVVSFAGKADRWSSAGKGRSL